MQNPQHPTAQPLTERIRSRVEMNHARRTSTPRLQPWCACECERILDAKFAFDLSGSLLILRGVPPPPRRSCFISASTRICAVYGHPIRHSASPPMQNAGFEALGLDWRYVAFDVAPERLAQAIEGAKAMKFAGLNLTVPHKLLALECVDVVDPAARRWGAVNTIRFEGKDQKGGWRLLATFEEEPVEYRTLGYNTDADAIVRAIAEELGLSVRNRSVLLLGAGGAGRAAALRLSDEAPSRMHLVNRTAARAEALAEEIRAQRPELSVEVGYPKGEVDLVINATSAGLKPEDPLPFDPGKFSVGRARHVFDMIYRPAETPFLRAAREAGCRAANGLAMLLYQGTRALEVWTGLAAPVDVMKRALWESVYGGANLKAGRS